MRLFFALAFTLLFCAFLQGAGAGQAKEKKEPEADGKKLSEWT